MDMAFREPTLAVDGQTVPKGRASFSLDAKVKCVSIGNYTNWAISWIL